MSGAENLNLSLSEKAAKAADRMINECLSGELKSAAIAAKTLKDIAESLPALALYENRIKSANARGKMPGSSATGPKPLRRPAGAEAEEAQSVESPSSERTT